MSDMSHENYMLHCRQMEAEAEKTRPSVLYRPSMCLDGNQYFVLYGQNLMDGCAGFGDSPDDAMRDFDANWYKSLPKTK